MEKYQIPQPNMKAPKRNKHWIVLFFKNQSRSISVKSFMWMTISSFAAVFTSVAVALCLFLLYQKAIADNKTIHNELARLLQQRNELQKENDHLMVSLVLAESKSNNKMVISADKKKTPTIKSPVILKASWDTTSTAPSEHIQKINAAKKVPKVAVENFKILSDPLGNGLRVNYKLKKIDPNSRTVTGRTYVMLKIETGSQFKWLILPSANSITEKSNKPLKGQFFSIARFKIVKLNHESNIDYHYIKEAKIFVHSKSGEPLLEKTIPFSTNVALTDQKSLS